jgi:hypothetical protein
MPAAELMIAHVKVGAGVVVGSSKVIWISKAPEPLDPETVNWIVVALATGFNTIAGLVPVEESRVTWAAIVLLPS